VLIRRLISFLWHFFSLGAGNQKPFFKVMYSSFTRSSKTFLSALSFSLALGIAPSVHAQTPVTISGQVFQDGNGGSINGKPIALLDNTPAQKAPIYVYLLDENNLSNTIVAKALVDSATSSLGNYTLSAQSNTNYNVRISTSNLAVGTVNPTLGFISSFVPTAEGSSPAGDGQPDFGVALNAGSSLTINFAINTRPKSVDYTITQPEYEANKMIKIPANAFIASDAEDGPYTAGLINRSVDLFQATGGNLFYNGAAINFATASSATRISNFNPALLRLQQTSIMGAASFAFATVDNAGTAEFTPSTIDIQGKPLSVSLLYFSAQQQGQNTMVLWSAAPEAGGLGFDVERSTDGISFSTIGHVASVTAEANSVDYRFEDVNVPSGATSGKIYYRLRQTAFSGQAEYSKVAVVNTTGLSKIPATLSVYPNPATDVLHVALNNAQGQPATVVLSDATGRVVNRSVTSQEGIATIEVSALPAGLYFIQYQIANSPMLTERIAIAR
jgi:hypothetical protein